MAKDKSANGFLDLLGGTRKPAPRTEEAASSPEGTASKARTQGELPGTELSTMADRQDGLLERVMNSRGHADPAAAKDDLAALQGVLTGLSQKTVVVIFAMGKLLAEVKSQLPHGDFIPWIEANCAFSRWSAFNYMRVYERYKDEPKRALAELSLSEAYVEAGIKKLAAPEADPEEPRRKGPAEYDVSQWRDWKRVFDAAPISGVILRRHRVVPYDDGRLYVVREETGPIPAVSLFADMSIRDELYQDALQEVHHNLQMALEVFYSKVEELEDKGVLDRPFDSSRATMAKRMRNVTPKDAESSGAAKKVPVTKAAKKGGKR